MADLYFEKFFDKPFIPIENPENGSFLGNPKNGFGPILGPCISTTKYEFEPEQKPVQKVTLEIPDSVLPKKGKEFVGWGSPPLLPSGNYNTPRGFLEQVNSLDNEVQKLLNSKEETPVPVVRKGLPCLIAAFNPKDFIKKEENMDVNSKDGQNTEDERRGRDRSERDRGKRERSITRSNSPPRKKPRGSPVKEREDRDGRKRQLSDADSTDPKKESSRSSIKDEGRDERKRDKSPVETRRDRSPRSDKSLKDTPKQDKSIRSTPKDDQSRSSPKDKSEDYSKTPKEKSDEQQAKTPKDKLPKSSSIPSFVPNAEFEYGVESGDWNLLGKAHKRFADDKLGGKGPNHTVRTLVHYSAALLCYYTDLCHAMHKETSFLYKKQSMEDYRSYTMKCVLKNSKLYRIYSLICYCEAFFLGYQYQVLQNNVRKYNAELGKVLKLEELSDKERLSNFEIKQKKLSDSIKESEALFEKLRGIYNDAYRFDPKMKSPFYGKPLGGSIQHSINGIGRARVEFLELANDLGVYPCFIKNEGGTKEKPNFKIEK
ncbi:hypothetical protein HDV04_004278 [Boothiomyces sp. JEL0838]|nr:hypothetical protein HDV04_004278 [Boothiomyces sp. JEL0838]